ncbi:hypothetical protein M501DRAFT_1061549 [Patellaria atrata CBS 101060]|uniref:Uncharacterized protein n=1 Tax=Patellaria atrata CBS 101060 TaxID=1346257 RepID=A0A9P4S1W9_9PEZI|nr:hypothetical protein M501DRAFT_1061549 [Patellaria atrata CBS 101060]
MDIQVQDVNTHASKKDPVGRSFAGFNLDNEWTLRNSFVARTEVQETNWLMQENFDISGAFTGNPSSFFPTTEYSPSLVCNPTQECVNPSAFSFDNYLIPLLQIQNFPMTCEGTTIPLQYNMSQAQNFLPYDNSHGMCLSTMSMTPSAYTQQSSQESSQNLNFPAPGNDYGLVKEAPMTTYFSRVPVTSMYQFGHAVQGDSQYQTTHPLEPYGQSHLVNSNFTPGNNTQYQLLMFPQTRVPIDSLSRPRTSLLRRDNAIQPQNSIDHFRRLQQGNVSSLKQQTFGYPGDQALLGNTMFQQKPDKNAYGLIGPQTGNILGQAGDPMTNFDLNSMECSFEGIENKFNSTERCQEFGGYFHAQPQEQTDFSFQGQDQTFDTTQWQDLTINPQKLLQEHNNELSAWNFCSPQGVHPSGLGFSPQSPFVGQVVSPITAYLNNIPYTPPKIPSVGQLLAKSHCTHSVSSPNTQRSFNLAGSQTRSQSIIDYTSLNAAQRAIIRDMTPSKPTADPYTHIEPAAAYTGYLHPDNSTAFTTRLTTVSNIPGGEQSFSHSRRNFSRTVWFLIRDARESGLHVADIKRLLYLGVQIVSEVAIPQYFTKLVDDPYFLYGRPAGATDASSSAKQDVKMWDAAWDMRMGLRAAVDRGRARGMEDKDMKDCLGAIIIVGKNRKK